MKFSIHFIVLPLVVLSFFSCSKGEVDQKPTAQPSTSYIQSIVDSFYTARPEAKGIIVHVVSAKEKGEGSAAVGFADLSKEIALRVENPVLIASNTKTYVSATLLRLVEEGLLTLDDPIGAYLGEDSANLLQQKGYDIDSITIRHLLSHRNF